MVSLNFEEFIFDEIQNKKSDKFSIYVEEYALANDMELFEALSAIVEDHQIDYEVVKSMLSVPFLQKLELEVITDKGKNSNALF